MAVSGLFAGIGGFELALSRAGFEAVLLAELDLAARSVLAHRFPDVQLGCDVLALDGLPTGTDVVTAGFPCQNLSMAGDKTGIEGEKSSVVKKLFHLIAGSTVPVVVIENVYFMLQLDSGRAMEWMVEQFEGLGYSWAYRVLDSWGFGLPQRRRRVYFVACLNAYPREVLFADDSTALSASDAIDLRKPIGFYWTEGRSGVGLTPDGIPPLKVGSTIGIPSPPAVLFPDGEVLLPSLEACERLQGFPVGWTKNETTSLQGRNPRWRLVGNAVSVPVARWVADRLKVPGAVRHFETFALQPGMKWPDAAWSVDRKRFGVKAGDRPISVPRCSISEFRDSSWTRLSHRALDGFIGRAEAGGLRMPEGFLTALRQAARK